MSSLTRVLPLLILSLTAGGLALALASLSDVLSLGGRALVGLATGMLTALLLRQPASRWRALLGGTLVGLALAWPHSGASSPALLLQSSADVLAAFITAGLFSRCFGTFAAFVSPDRLAWIAGLSCLTLRPRRRSDWRRWSPQGRG